MSIVSLVSGGLDSTLMALLIREEGIQQFPLFVDYGQRSRARELTICRRVFNRYKLPKPRVVDLAGYGNLIKCGLTDKRKHIFEDAFLPGRNLMFLLIAGAYAYQKGAAAVCIGLLSEEFSLFPDQTKCFIVDAEKALTCALGRTMKVLIPLMSYSKQDVIKVARDKDVSGTYSCHSGNAKPCGVCVACREYQ